MRAMLEFGLMAAVFPTSLTPLRTSSVMHRQSTLTMATTRLSSRYTISSTNVVIAGFSDQQLVVRVMQK